MINSNLLKEAIADAKAVRNTAIANARAALEEAFAPRFEAMFAEKIKEDTEEEDEEKQEMDEVEAPHNVASAGGEANPGSTKAVSKGQPKKMTSDNDFVPVKAGKGPSDVGEPTKKVMEAKEEEDEAKEEMDETYEEDAEEDEGMEEAKKKKFLQKAIDPKHKGYCTPMSKPTCTPRRKALAKRLKPGGDLYKGKTDEGYEEEEGVQEAGLTSEELDEIIKELESEVEHDAEGEEVSEPQIDVTPGDDTDVEVEPGAEADVEVEPDAEADVEVEPDAEADVEVEPDAEAEIEPEVQPEAEPRRDEQDEEINLDELLTALNEATEEEDEAKEEMDEAKETGVPSNVSGQDAHKGPQTYPITTSNKDIEAKKTPNTSGPAIKGKGNIGGGEATGKPVTECAKSKAKLSEAYEVITYLRKQINEVNLLNAKLLYTNKLFKEYASSLDDKDRMQIVEKFDLTKNVREVKLAYAILAESLSFGRNKSVKSSTPSNRAVNSQTVKQITEGLASKPVASTKPSKEILSEGGNEMAERFKTLAGIRG